MPLEMKFGTPGANAQGQNKTSPAAQQFRLVLVKTVN
jgi:hypothetical protein